MPPPEGVRQSSNKEAKVIIFPAVLAVLFGNGSAQTDEMHNQAVCSSVM
jgi:hypothetical protein